MHNVRAEPSKSFPLFHLEWHHTASCGCKKGQQQYGEVAAGQRGQNWCKDQGKTFCSIKKALEAELYVFLDLQMFLSVAIFDFAQTEVY